MALRIAHPPRTLAKCLTHAPASAEYGSASVVQGGASMTVELVDGGAAEVLVVALLEG